MKVIIPKGCRSDAPLSDPLIKTMENDDFFKLFTINLYPANFLESFGIMDHFCKIVKPDLVMIIGDRVEMAGAANAVFLNNIPIAHLGAGVINDIGNNWDDILRHNITLMADIALCEDYNSTYRTAQLWDLIGKINFDKHNSDILLKDYNIHIIGNPYVEGLDDIDLSLVPDEPYDLILLNPTTLHEEQITLDKERLMIIIGPNPDPSKIDFINIQITVKNDNKFYHNLPRPQFLGLLSKCERYISNSSNVYYEAPHFLSPKQIIHIGARNVNRSTPTNLEGGSTLKIIKILKEWWEKKNENI